MGRGGEKLNGAGRAALVGCVVSLTCFLAAETLSQPAERDWPCVQRKVPHISAGMVWSGPAINETDESWRRDAASSELAARIAARTMDLSEAEAAVQTYANGLADDGKTQKLTQLFAGVLAVVNAERDAVILGIARYARRQQSLAAKIERATGELEGLAPGGSPAQSTRREDLRRQVDWDTRIFEERERSLTFVCETPVLLEQRAFALARTIMSHLD